MNKKIVINSADLNCLSATDAPAMDLYPLVATQVYVPKDSMLKSYYYIATLDKGWRPPAGCPHCGQGQFTRADYILRKIHDLPKGRYHIQIQARIQRYRCINCNHKFVPDLQEIITKQPMTTRLYNYIHDECLLRPYNDLSSMTGIPITSIQHIADMLIQQQDVNTDNKYKAPEILGIDETHLSGKRQYGILVDNSSRRLIDILPNNDPDTIKQAICQMENWHSIKTVTIDMANDYISWLPTFLPGAKIVVDKFHVFNALTIAASTTISALCKIKQSEVNCMHDLVEKTDYQNVLNIAKRNKRLLFYTQADISASPDLYRDLTHLFTKFPDFKMIWQLLHFSDFLYQQKDYDAAVVYWDEQKTIFPPKDLKPYQDWCKNHQVVDCFDSFRQLRIWDFKEYILNYFLPQHNQTNACAESFNRIISEIAKNRYDYKHLRARFLAKQAASQIPSIIDFDL